jgi:hypothetical protein
MKRAPKTVDEALNQFWRSRSHSDQSRPDYIGFAEWLAGKFEEERAALQVPIHALGPNTASLDLYAGLIEAANSAGIRFTPSEVVIDEEQIERSSHKLKLKQLNQLKLLLMCFKDLRPRQLELLALLQSKSLKPVTRSSNQLEHRNAFFLALNKGDQHEAY